MSLYQKVVRHLFVPLSLWREGETAQLRYLRQFERTQFLSEEEIRYVQECRLRTLVRHAYRNCPFYRDRFQQAGMVPADIRHLEDLRALPPLEKRDIQERGPRLMARNWAASDLIRNQTGG